MSIFARRPVIGIPFNYDENWIGGTYYIKNLISALDLLPAGGKPDVWLLSHGQNSYDFIRRATGYPRLNWIRPALLSGIDGGISRRAKWLTRLAPRLMKRKINFDMIFPYPIDTSLQQTVCWIPDFQDKRLPELFTSDELKARERQHRNYFENYRHLVFSSKAALSDFNEFYPEAMVEKHVVRFAVFEQFPQQADVENVVRKYDLPVRYFYCPNQFWIHKNHDVVIRAVSLLKERGVKATIVFSGREHDHRAPGHADKLKAHVAAAGLTSEIRFLGFIPRDEQMVIFRQAVSVIQPSLFEGWSTVIEDAKSLSQHVLASRIPANVEQVTCNVDFFDPHDPFELATLIRKYAEQDPPREHIDYRVHQLEFAHAFMSVARAVVQSN